MDSFTVFAERYLGTSDVSVVRESLWGDDGLELISKMSPDPSSISTPGGAASLNRPGKFSKPVSAPSRSSKTKATVPTSKTRGTLRPTGQKVAPIARPKRSPKSSAPTTSTKSAVSVKPTKPMVAKTWKPVHAAPFVGRAADSLRSSKAGGVLRATGKKIKETHGPVKDWERTTGKAAGFTAAAAAGLGAVRGGKRRVENYRFNNDLYRNEDVPDRFYKSDGATFDCDFSKVDADKRQVFGWASIISKDGKPVVDRQGDWIAAEEIEKSAYSYVVKSRKGGNEHRRERSGETPFQASDMIESFVVTPEKRESMNLGDDVPDGWWVGFKVSDDKTWDEVKSGALTGFSVHGKGKRQKMEPELVE